MNHTAGCALRHDGYTCNCGAGHAKVQPLTAKHTPGPWTLKPAEDGEFREPGNGDAAVVGSNLVSPGIVWQNDEEGRANARLIAAAPELLEALEAVQAELDSGAPNIARRMHALGVQISAAIAKAKGETK